MEICFLGHRVSRKGIEADEGKADRIQNWPHPSCAKHVRGFLGLVRYLSAFLPHLANHMRILDELTTKECDKIFLTWTNQHQDAFDAINAMMLSTDCLTTIDPSLMPNHKIFVTTDASCHGRSILLPLIFHFERHVTVGYFT